MKSDLIKHLRFEEGVRSSAYRDHKGYLTIGVGRLIDARLNGGLSDDEINYLLGNDLTNVFDELDKHIPWWRDTPSGAQMALSAMCFQMGWPRLSKFKKTLALLKDGEYHAASVEAKDSKWAKQTPERAERVCRMMRG